jgi:hypothetical protein
MIAKFNTFLQSIVAALLTILPNDPFKQYINNISISPYVKYINWIIPVGSCLTILTAWLAAIAVFYIYQIALRWAKVVGE